MKATQHDSTEYQVATDIVKKALKKRSITYKELAEGIGLSESGVKKVLGGKDGSFQRLIEICRFIGISPVELIDDRKVVDVGFTEDQQQNFSQNPKLFYFYWLLVYERRSLENAKATLKLSKAEAFKFLRKLDLLHLIKLLPGERLRIPSIKAVRWKVKGKFIETIYRKWARELLERVSSPEPPEGRNYFNLRYLQMKESTLEEFIASIRSIEEEFIRRSIYEMRTQASDLKHVRWLTALDDQSFI